MLIGAHESVAGGLEKAYGAAEEDRCEALQIFTKNSNQWREPPLSDAQVEAFRKARAASSLAKAPVLAHDSYLINLCAADDAIRQRSRESLLQEALRCEKLGVEYVVLHPGAHLGAGVEHGIAGAVEALAWVIGESKGAKVSLLVENTAGQGSAIGVTFAEVGAIVRGVEKSVAAPERGRIGVCLDTCHAFAAGYDLSCEEGFDKSWAELEREVGQGRLRAMHLNDCKKPLGCRVDRHERLGLGELGLWCFWRLMNERALEHVVGVLETPPVEKDRAYAEQLQMLMKLRGAPPPKREQAPAKPVEEAKPAQPKPAKRARARST